MRSFLVDLGLIAVMVFLFVAVAWQVTDRSPIVDPISVPAGLAALGYSSEAVTNRLIARSRAIERENNARVDKGSAAAATTSSPFDKVTVPNSGVSLSAVVDGLRSFFDVPIRRIGGSIVVDESGGNRAYRMTVWVSGRNSDVHTGDANASIEHVIEHGARALSGMLRPCVLAAQLVSDPHGESWLDECFSDPSGRDIEWAHNLRGLRYLEQGKYDEAIRHFEKALEYAKGYQNARNNLLEARQRSGQPSPGKAAPPAR